jgi:hypothetical protein
MTAAENPYAGQGSVLLDIGGDVGALLVTMPAALEGAEVEINRIDGHDHDQHGPAHDHDHHHDHHRPHVAVVPRPTAAGLVHSLVFPELTEGRYELYLRPAGPVQLTVGITGGAVTEAVWP